MSCFIVEFTLYIQSQQYLNGVLLFLVKVFKELNFEMHHCGIKCTVTILSKNTVMTLHPWSGFEEVFRYLKNMEIGNKKCIL